MRNKKEETMTKRIHDNKLNNIYDFIYINDTPFIEPENNER